MKHFSDEAWVDFARQLLPSNENERMRAHLAVCQDCRVLHRLWTQVTESARVESQYAADESTVASAKAMFAGTPRRSPLDMASGFMELVFDSLSNAELAVGVRSLSASARHLLYRSNLLAVDVRIDAIREDGVAIAGQILAANTDTASGSLWQVTLSDPTTTVGQAFTNKYGEFYFESDTRPDLRIRVEAEGQRSFTLILPD